MFNKSILEKLDGPKIKINLESLNEVLGECSFYVRNFVNFIVSIESEEYTHEVNKDILDYFILEKFEIDNKIKEKTIKSYYRNNGACFNTKEIKEAYIKAEILVETEIEINDDGDVVSSDINTVTDPNTLDDVNSLESGIGDNQPLCGPKAAAKQFEDCDLEYGLEVFCYNASKIPWADNRLHFPIFRGLYSIFDNSNGRENPPLSCGYLVNNDYAQGGCRSVLEFPKDGENIDTLRTADLHYEFFVEELEGYEDNPDIPPYIFQIGHGGSVDLYPVIKDVIRTDKEKIDATADAKNRDYNGLFTEDDISYIKKNKPSEYQSENYAYLIEEGFMGYYFSPADQGTPASGGRRPQIPAVVTHGSYSVIMTEENIIINEQIFLNEGNVEPETETGATEEGGGTPQNFIIDLGKVFPMRVIAVTKDPLDIEIDDIINGEIPDISGNLFRGVVRDKDSVNLRGDHNAVIAGQTIGLSKYIKGYDIEEGFNEEAVNTDILKRIIGPQENFGSRKQEAENFFYTDYDILSDQYKYNSLNSNKIKIDSSAVRTDNDTENGSEPIVNPSIYLTAIVANNNNYRQIIQTHNRVSNRRPTHSPEDRPVLTINPPSPGQLPMPDGKYIDIETRVISESFIFDLFCHNIDNRIFYEWRMTELANDAWLIWKRWFINSQDGQPIYPPGAGFKQANPNAESIQNETSSPYQGGTYGYNESEPMFYTGDSEGIKVVLVDKDGKFTSKVLLEREKIWDQKWFDHFLQANGREGMKFEDNLGFTPSLIDYTREVTRGLLFDVSYYINNNIPDAAKIPYERCFAAAIMQCSKAVIPTEDDGGGEEPDGGLDSGDVSNEGVGIDTPRPSEGGGGSEDGPIKGIGIQPLDLINNPYINIENVPDIIEEENSVLWCEPNDGGGNLANLIENVTSPRDKLLLKESLEILVAKLEADGKSEEAATAKAYLENIINQEKIRRPNDLSFSVFVSKIADFRDKATVSGYQRRALVRRFSEEDKNGEFGYITQFQSRQEYKDTFGPDGEVQSTIIVPADGSKVYAYAREQEEADRDFEDEGVRNLPPGRYVIKYLSGGFQYGCGDGRKASIHDPNSDCDGVYVTFNSAAPCAETQFIAPGTREEFNNIGDIEVDFFGTEDSERTIVHLGGPITFQLILNERDLNEECDDGQSVVFCDEDTCLKYCVYPEPANGQQDTNDLNISPVITDQWDDFATTSVKNYVELPTLYEPEGLSENSRIYVESFAIPRFDDKGISDKDYLHPQFNCLGMYPDHPVEHLNLIDIGDNNLFGDISVASFNKRHDAILVTPEFNTGSMSYHIVNFEKHGSWTGFGIAPGGISEFVNLTERTSGNSLNVESEDLRLVEEKVKGRADQIQRWGNGFYNRGKIINTVDGAICVGKICARSIEGPSYNLVDEDEAYFFTDGKELRDSLSGVINRDIKGWVKYIEMSVPTGVYRIDTIGITPFGKNSQGIVSGTDLGFLGQIDDSIPVSTKTFEDGPHLLYNLTLSNLSLRTIITPVYLEYGRVQDGGELIFESGSLEPSNIAGVKYLKDEIFEKYKVNNTRNCTVVDEKNRVFVFYELKGNIACAMGHNLNTPKEQWFNFEGLVRTLAGEKASNPYVVSSANGKTFYLFFKLNNQYICQQTMASANFVIKDAFKEYWPIASFNADTSEDYGLGQFEFEGRDIRKGPINIIAGGAPNVCSSSIDIETEGKERVDAGLKPRIRLAFNCLRNEKVAEEEFAAYKDKKGHLVLFFTTDRQFMNIMWSNNEGQDWQDVQRYMHMTHWPFDEKTEEYDFECDTGLSNNVCLPSTYLIEEDASSLCDTKVLSRMEIVFDEVKGIIYLIYIYDESLFVRQFDSADIEKIAGVLPGSARPGVKGIIENKFNLSKNSENKPVKIAGKSTDEEEEGDGLENAAVVVGSESDDSGSLFVKLKSATAKEVKEKGNGVFQLSRPGGHVTKDGILKIYYFDKDLIVWSISLTPGELKTIPKSQDIQAEGGNSGDGLGNINENPPED